jgi:diguanylate cyclase (GGDEF)-like protein
MRRIQGHCNYFGVSGNFRSLLLVVEQARRSWYKWLCRRSQRTIATIRLLREGGSWLRPPDPDQDPGRRKRDPRQFSADDLALLRDLARMAEQELAALQLATMDELTMLSNRRGFLALGLHALALCRRLEKPASLLYFDLDRFKEINDAYGHAEGDRALTSFARLLKETFRESDVIGRLGGDEFAVLLTDTDQQSSNSVLVRLAEAVTRHNREARRGYDIAYSVGTVALDLARHSDVGALMADADARMYTQKRSRRPNHEAA